MYQQYFKRALDLGFVILSLPVTLPAVLLTALLLLIIQKGNVFFKQVRPGQHGKFFTIYKFKTMRDACAPDGTLLPDAERLTQIGQLVRRYSLDELPQLWNVLKGDLSLVGPRPLLPEYLPLYSPEQAKRHQVKPGITGWAQINGRNAITWEQKFNYDVWYAENQSFFLDLKILARTFVKLWKPTDIQAPGSATAERFTGTLPHAS
ncbi:putative sugar transferase EpsL [Adhaeribacter aerolatus]|uniref:Putative sugar transferase EpsL n=1 Tax=Adhaeribacter aerolatus TaxID=670289 RepID=A0A512B4J0_9BACT|nr:sugar transferase [Adhaeribacter aerolatus]GEO06842.1 putative sugar transferase EpsL [Adhaeribacter aerolatus]